MSDSPLLGFPEAAESTALPWDVVNLIGRFCEQMASRGIVLDKDLATPPGSPSEGDAYIVATGGTGAWSGWDDRIAFRAGGTWYDLIPVEGWRAYVQDESAEYEYDGADWGAPSGAVTFATNTDVWAGTSTTDAVTPDALQDASAPVALTSSASVTPDLNAGMNFTITLAHSGQLENPSNVQAGDSGVIVITQDGTGSRTWTYGSDWKFPGGAPVLSTAAASVDCIAYYAVTTSLILANLTKDYSS